MIAIVTEDRGRRTEDGRRIKPPAPPAAGRGAGLTGGGWRKGSGVAEEYMMREGAMAFFIHRDTNLNKRLKNLRRLGGIPALIAEHAEAILDNVVEAGSLIPKQIGRMTRYREARIKNCIKYDLIYGYRLIGIIGRKEIAFVYVGHHEECRSLAPE